MDAEELEYSAKISDYLMRMGKPITQDELESTLKLSALQIAKGINLLVQAHKIQILQKNSELFYSYLDETSQEKSIKKRELTYEENLIYQIIEEEGNKGIWMRDLRTRSALPATKITKILSTLEGKKLIKSVTPLEGKRKKIYMLYDLQPNKKLFGGAFINTETKELDTIFIDTLYNACFRIINEKGHSTTRDICVQLNQISNEQLEIEEIQQIVDLLLYDGKIETVQLRKETSLLRHATSTIGYKPSRMSLPHSYYAEIPCCRCPVADVCSDDGDVTPQKCVYLQKWLDF